MQAVLDACICSLLLVSNHGHKYSASKRAEATPKSKYSVGSMGIRTEIALKEERLGAGDQGPCADKEEQKQRPKEEERSGRSLAQTLGRGPFCVQW